MTAPWPRIALVATPDVGAAVFYEFNLNPRIQVAHQGFDLGAPQWNGEPGAQGGTEGYRTINFTHWVDGGDAAAVTEMSTLGQLLTADYQWLLIQSRSGAAPTWAKVWRSTPGALSWDDLRIDKAVKGRYGIPLSSTADPYLVGANIALATGQTVNNDPAAGSNPNVLVLGAVVGDAPAPAVLSVDNDNKASRTALHQMAVVPAGYTAPSVLQFGSTESWKVGSSNMAGSATVDAAYSGGSYRATVFTGAQSLTWGTVTVVPGDYMALLRITPVSATQVIKVSVSAEIGGLHTITTTFSAGAGNTPRWVLVGTLRIPLGAALPDSIIAGAPSSAYDISVGLDRISGTGEANVDCLVLVPAPWTSRTLLVENNAAVTGTPPQTIDGVNEVVYSRASPTGAFLKDLVAIRGGFPLLWPGQTNALHIYGNVDRSDTTDVITHTFGVDVTYRPRWLWPQP